eukprot:4799436-Pyramimonas_sp.AAC.1
MPLVAEPANNAGAPAATAPAGLPATDLWLRRIQRATERSAHWFQVSHTYVPYGRGIRPRNQRRAEIPVSARSERDMLHSVLMVNAD